MGSLIFRRLRKISPKSGDPEHVMGLLKSGTLVAIDAAHKTLLEVRRAMGIDYFSESGR
jgi:hypothetical protein